MHIALTSGPSTICNIDITPPTAVIVPESPHHDKIALFCANICKTDSPQQLRRLVIPLDHGNDRSVPTPSVAAWPPTISIVDVLLEVLFLQAVANKNDNSSTLTLSAMEKREREREREREMFYLTTHSTHFIYGYMASDIWLRTILIVRKETRCRHMGYSYRLTARVLLYASSHRQDNTYHGLCYTSRGALAGTRSNGEESSSQMEVGSVFRQRQRRGARYADACVIARERERERERERLMGWAKHHGLGSHRDHSSSWTSCLSEFWPM